jgi:hypothetical protein
MSQPFIWGNLLHLSQNMWTDRDGPDVYWSMRDHLLFNKDLWDELTEEMVNAGMNLLVIDLGDGVRYASHPEIAVEGAWSRDELQQELKRLRDLGLEPIPKMNFSTGHDAWLKEYSRMVSTPAYYQVCADLIGEVIELFDRPRFFHLGMDEETAENQRDYNYVVIRQHELYWHDLAFLIQQVENREVRAWIWSDMVWDKPEEWLAHVPKSVLQSNWYYFNEFDSPTVEWRDRLAPAAYRLLEEHGYDQIPTGSNWATAENFALTVAYCREVIAPERLKGFLMAPWKPTTPEWRQHHLKAIQYVAEVIEAWKD